METNPSHRIRNRLWLASLALGLAIGTVAIGGVVYWSTAIAEDDLDSELQAEILELMQGPFQDGPEALALEIRRRILNTDSLGHIYLFAESRRTMIEGTWPEWPDELLAENDLQTFAIDDEPPLRVGIDRQVRIAVQILPSGRRLAVGHDVTEHHRVKRGLQLGALGTIALTLAIAMAGGILVSRRLLDRISAMRNTVIDILSGDRDSRVPLNEPTDEFDMLAKQFNSLLDENQSLLRRMREVTDEVAHDLRTPLARMRAQIENGINTVTGEAEQRELLHSLQSELDEILDTFNALLHIAQIETGRAQEEMVPVELTSLSADIVELYEPVFEEAGLQLRSHLDPGISIIGNRHLLAQALTNLIENALKYAGRGVVTLSLRPSSTIGEITLSISDQGPGIPKEEHSRVLQRFARLETARSRPGAGLGLSFVDAVAKVHNARLDLDDMNPGLKVSLHFYRST